MNLSRFRCSCGSQFSHFTGPASSISKIANTVNIQFQNLVKISLYWSYSVHGLTMHLWTLIGFSMYTKVWGQKGVLSLSPMSVLTIRWGLICDKFQCECKPLRLRISLPSVQQHPDKPMLSINSPPYLCENYFIWLDIR